jgi:hypothetical protein
MRTSRALVTTTLSAGTLLLGAVAAPAASASDYDDRKAGAGFTTVVLDPALVPVLVDKLGVAPIRPAVLSAPGGVTQVAFPITDVSKNEIEHSGGLRFTPIGGGSLKITEFEVELDDGVLEAEVRLNGKSLQGDVDIFALGEPQKIGGAVPDCAGTQAGLSLTEEAAAALGAPDFAGTFVGDACVVPKG